jgi:hypothetical protein
VKPEVFIIQAIKGTSFSYQLGHEKMPEGYFGFVCIMFKKCKKTEQKCNECPTAH